MIPAHPARRVAACVALLVCSATGAHAQDGANWANEFFAKAEAEAAKASALAAAAKPVRKRAFTARPEASAGDERESTSLAGNAITWLASSGCVPKQLRGVLADIVSTFGPITVSSTCRSVSANRAAGGATHSYHLSGEAVDFRVSGNAGAVHAALAANGAVGGLKHYGGGLFHIDTGPRRPF
jgi:Peptidase M15